MDRRGRCFEQFISTAKDLLSSKPELGHEWQIDDKKRSCSLVLRKQEDQGFDIQIDVDDHGIIVFAAGAYERYHLGINDNPTETIQESMGMVRDLLSPSMRIREKLSNNRPYKYVIESFNKGKWHKELSTGLLVWNYFGKRSENVYQKIY